MNNTFSLEQIAKTGDLNAGLIMRQNKLDKTSKFMEIKSINPKLKQSKIVREPKISSSTLQRDRREKNMLSPNRISNCHTRKQKTSKHTEHDLKMTSKDLKMTSEDANENDEPISKKVKTMIKSRGGDPNDNHTQGKILIEQVFSSPING